MSAAGFDVSLLSLDQLGALIELELPKSHPELLPLLLERYAKICFDGSDNSCDEAAVGFDEEFWTYVAEQQQHGGAMDLRSQTRKRTAEAADLSAQPSTSKPTLPPFVIESVGQRHSKRLKTTCMLAYS